MRMKINKLFCVQTHIVVVWFFLFLFFCHISFDYFSQSLPLCDSIWIRLKAECRICVDFIVLFQYSFFIYLFKYRYSAFDHWFFVLFSLLWWVWYMTLTLLSRHLFSFMKCSCPMKAKTSRQQQQQQCYFYARQGSKKQSPATYCHHKNYLYATEIPP